jgi:hypothetical protein
MGGDVAVVLWYLLIVLAAVVSLAWLYTTVYGIAGVNEGAEGHRPDAAYYSALIQWVLFSIGAGVWLLKVFRVL